MTMRTFWILFGVGTHLLFALTVCRLFPFLQGEGWAHGLFASATGTMLGKLGLDGLLATQFAVIHSWFLLPGTRDRLTRFIPSPQYGCGFSLVTCMSLLLTIEAWQPVAMTLWQLQGLPHTVMMVAFLLAWAGLFYSLHLTGLGYQTGWTPWWAWLRRRKLPPRAFATHGAYRILRHPIYLSFLGLIWLTPRMTPDRVLLTALWTAYIFIGSRLKDRRLLHYVGDPYRQYQARVPGYPFLPFGPLGKVPLAPVSSASSRRAA